MDFPKRLVELINDKGLSQSDFTTLLKMPRASLVKILSGATKNPGIKLLIEIHRYFPEVNLHWLLTGEGKMYRSSTEVLGDLSSSNEPDAPYGREMNDAMQVLLETAQRQNEQYEQIIIKTNPELAKTLGLLR